MKEVQKHSKLFKESFLFEMESSVRLYKYISKNAFESSKTKIPAELPSKIIKSSQADGDKHTLIDLKQSKKTVFRSPFFE